MATRTFGLTCLGLVLALAGCRSIPATIEVEDSAANEPVPKVFTEAETKPPAPSPGPAPIAEEYAQLYQCWFDRPYPYMFADLGEPLLIDGRSVGMLMAGISGILYYGNFNECAGELAGQEPRSYSDIAPLEALAKVPATLDRAGLPFDRVNPEFVNWARTELLPPGDQLIAGLPVQMAYDRVFQRFFRAMATSAAWLLESGQLDTEAKQYLTDVEAGAYGIDWLEQRYAGSIPINDAYADGTMMTGSMAAGFWLRRELDGSLAVCWHGLADVLERYDQVWFRQLEQSYPRGVAALESRPDPLASEGGQ